MIKPFNFTQHASKLASSNQIKNAQAPGMSPAFTNRRVRLSPRFHTAEEQARAKSALQFYLAGGSLSRLQALRGYRALCQEANIQPVSGVTFLRRLRGLPSLPQPQRSHFLAVALIDETVVNFPVCGGTSS